MNSVRTNLATVRAKCHKAALIAVSKTHNAQTVELALMAGQRLFGENRVQEAKEKFVPLRLKYPDIELHLIGALQTNKAADAVALFDVIQTVDRPRLADALSAALKLSMRKPTFYIEVNVGREPQKAGIEIEQTPEFLTYCREHCGLSVTGLMCIPPMGQDPRGFFQDLAHLAKRLALPHISMGMSQDFEIAIECGATEVRVGSAIFGTRPHTITSA